MRTAALAITSSDGAPCFKAAESANVHRPPVWPLPHHGRADRCEPLSLSRGGTPARRRHVGALLRGVLVRPGQGGWRGHQRARPQLPRRGGAAATAHLALAGPVLCGRGDRCCALRGRARARPSPRDFAPRSRPLSDLAPCCLLRCRRAPLLVAIALIEAPPLTLRPPPAAASAPPSRAPPLPLSPSSLRPRARPSRPGLLQPRAPPRAAGGGGCRRRRRFHQEETARRD